MAKAGWIFNGGTAEDSDIATCFYCGKSLDGWEMGDDPTKEHKNRVPNCPVFTAKLTAEAPSPPTPVIDLDPIPEPEPATRPPVSTTSTKTRTTSKRGQTQTQTQPATIYISDTAGTESDAPSQAKRGRPKKSAAVKEREESVLPSDSQGGSSKDVKPKKTGSRTTSNARKERVETPDVEEVIKPISTTTDKGKKGKGKKVETMDLDAMAPPPPREPIKPVESRATSVSVSGQEDEDATIKLPKKKPTKKKATKKGKTSRAASVTSQEPDAMEMDEPPVDNGVEEDVTPVPVVKSGKGKDSLGGWESMEAANLELEEMAKELDIEGEFMAIGKKPEPSTKSKSKSERAATGSKVKKPDAKKAVVKKEEKKPAASDDQWAWREKSVEAKSVVTELETEMTEEDEADEVEKSLAGDSDDERPSPPPSRGASTNASTTVSSKTKAKIKEEKMAKGAGEVARKMMQVQEMWDEDMVDGSTPKPTPSGPAPAPATAEPTRPANVVPEATAPSNHSRGFNTSMNTQLEAPTISADINTYLLTEEEREMTLEEWIRFDVERRKEEIRIEGRKWIESFLENADAMRDRIRTL